MFGGGGIAEAGGGGGGGGGIPENCLTGAAATGLDGGGGANAKGGGGGGAGTSAALRSETVCSISLTCLELAPYFIVLICLALSKQPIASAFLPLTQYKIP